MTSVVQNPVSPARWHSGTLAPPHARPQAAPLKIDLTNITMRNFDIDQANILLLGHRVPYPPAKGDRIRNFHLLKHLSRHAAVQLACLADEPVSDETLAELRPYCARPSCPANPAVRPVRRAGKLSPGRDRAP